jgi:hypothetical protein
MFSFMPRRTFSTPQIFDVNGKPTTDSDGNSTIVTEVDAKPTVLLPMVMLSYRIPGLSNYDWENNCPNHCAFLVSGGIGLNTSNTTAEYAVGLSFQVGSLLLTGAWHIGWDTKLDQGVQLHQKFGAMPPTLPIKTFWSITHGGIVISYVLPLS